MKWVVKEPCYADMIRMKMGEFYHYGVFVSQDEIIQFGLAPIARPRVRACDVEVCVSNMEVFLCGCTYEVGVPERKDLKTLRSPDEIVKTARSRIGEKNYNVLYNNCEHFAYECILGKKYCSQAKAVERLLPTLPITNVYFAKIPLEKPIGELPFEKANDYLNAASSEIEKRGRYFAWKLFEYAVERTYFATAEKVKISALSNKFGKKWKSNKCNFDFVYTDDVVAVVISRGSARIALSKDKAALPFSEWQTEVADGDESYFISVRTKNVENLRFFKGYEF